MVIVQERVNNYYTSVQFYRSNWKHMQLLLCWESTDSENKSEPEFSEGWKFSERFPISDSEVIKEQSDKVLKIKTESVVFRYLRKILWIQ